MQKIFQTEETTDSQALRKGKRKRTEPMDSENVNSDPDKAQVGVLLLGVHLDSTIPFSIYWCISPSCLNLFFPLILYSTEGIKFHVIFLLLNKLN